MQVFGVTGRSGSGKTTLVVRLIAEFDRRGLTVSTIKHAHHGFEPDHPGKDSHAHRAAGAREVLLAGPERWALFHEYRDEPERSPEQLLERLAAVDLVIAEGYQGAPWPRLEVWRGVRGEPPLAAAGTPGIVALATDRDAGPEVRVPVLALEATDAIATFMLEFLARRMPPAGLSRP